jgi:DNA-binding transcriptional ArsR family regulator
MVRWMAHHVDGLDRTFHALADPTRRAVIDVLTTRGALSVTELAVPYPIGLPTFLKHLKMPEDSGLVSTATSGRIRTCRVGTERLDEAGRWLSRRHDAVGDQLDRSSNYVEGVHRTGGARP